MQNNFEVCIENDRLNGLQRIKNGYYSLCIIDSNITMTSDLMLVEKIRQIDAADSPISDKAKTINNNLFVGSTSELQKVLQDMKKNDES